MGQERRDGRNDAGAIRTGQGQHILMFGHGRTWLQFGRQGTAIGGPALSPAAPLRQSRARHHDEQTTGDPDQNRIMADRLNGYRILILETREEAQFSRLLAEQGADVLQCPMFTIHDAPDPAPIEAWIRRFIDKPFDDLVLMTGEGLRRLMKVARRMDVGTGIHRRGRQGAQIRPRPEARPGAARDRAGAAGDDGEADLRRHRRDAGAPRSGGTSRRPAALSRQGSRRADRRHHGARAPRSIPCCPTFTTRRPPTPTSSPRSTKWRKAASTPSR